MKSQKRFKLLDICAYVNCNKSRNEGYHLYHFPEEDNPLLKEWISKIGNPALEHYADSSLRKMGVCADHFLPEMFQPNLTKYTKIRKLRMNAIPEPPKNLSVNEEKEHVQASQPVIKKQRMKKRMKEEEEHQYHHHYHQQQQEAKEREVEEEGENELFINKPILKNTKLPLIFSDYDDSMEWAEEMKLENECTQLLKKNKNLKIQIKYLKRKFERIKRSRDRYYKLLCNVETIDKFLHGHECENDAIRALVKPQLESAKHKIRNLRTK